MATVSLDVPPAINVEIPAHTRWAELNEQPQRGKVDRNTVYRTMLTMYLLQ